MISVDVTIVLVALATTTTIIIIGLGFLPFPARAAAIWSAAFATAMVSSYVLVAANEIGSPQLRAASVAPILAAVGLLWVGLRARRGVEPILILPTVLLFCAFEVALILAAETEWYGLLYRGAFAAGGIYAGLSAKVLFGERKPLRDLGFPLLVANLGLAVVSALLTLDGLVRVFQGEWRQNEQDMTDVLSLSALVASIYLVCAIVSLLAIVRGGDVQSKTRETADFHLVAQERLDRAKAAGDRWWSVVDVRLDDPDELLEASSGRAFDRVTARFADDIRSIMPPEADIHALSRTQYVVLLPRPDTAVRVLLSRLLERIATVTDTQAVPVRLSASIGVATATIADYRLDRLCAAAADAAAHAQLEGGDRWERAVFAG
ncbi:hypothetical protein AB3M83_12795 [Microbacterium sp. 179-B 1A2 NHS]|uniref:hypothetical protein n=1 Tax=Microbacterium sp. 179-B 1A2 NHS TaxID=3142383 RepID=UPI0039A266DB